ncbi:MAG TPA: CBS domain-containing protein [Candidatus Methylomirabilis sp.]|nr:CBS domain-containing protein [Candidatus Methylomirabilis sp.]
MSSQVSTIGPSESCLDAVAQMHRAKARHLPVVNREGMLVGIVTDRDIRHHLFSPHVFNELGTPPLDVVLRAVRVAEIMSTAVITIAPEDDITEASRVMREEKIGALPVIDGRRVVGIITETDLLRQICRADAAVSPACAEIIVSYP